MRKELRTETRSDNSETFGHLTKVQKELGELDYEIKTTLLPWHGDEQFVGTGNLLCTPLFSIAHRGARLKHTSLALGDIKGASLTYDGPELRQDDGLVFMALLNVAQDYRPGTLVSFDARALCQAIIGTTYGGSAREHLRKAIQRLQDGTLTWPTFRVHLIERFDFPQREHWSVSLDKDVVHLFRDAPNYFWMKRQLRTDLPTGLTTWLYGYIRCQSKLIPTSLQQLRDRCGSQATPKSFRESMSEALTCLSAVRVIEPGWWLERGFKRVHWMKGENGCS